MTVELKTKKQTESLWATKPTAIKRFLNKTNYLFIDESGDYSKQSFDQIKLHFSEGKEISKNFELFSMIGILIQGKELKSKSVELRKIKRKFFAEKFLENEELCFHAREMYNKNCLVNLLENKEIFDEEWDKFIIDTNFKLFASYINKKDYYLEGKYMENKPNNVFEKTFIDLLDSVNNNSKVKNIVVVYESISEKKDRKLLNLFNGYVQNGRWTKFKGIYFMPKRVNIRGKNRAIYGFELADALQYPIQEYALAKNYHKIKNKFYFYPYHENKTLNSI